jgi:hypothetical protein
MSKAKSRTTPADGWRQHQLRRRDAGKGKHAMPAGRYSETKKTLHNGVAIRHGRMVFTADQAETLIEIATLVTCTDGFTYTPAMMKLNKLIAAAAGPNYRRACISEAAAREHAYVAR